MGFFGLFFDVLRCGGSDGGEGMHDNGEGLEECCGGFGYCNVDFELWEL